MGRILMTTFRKSVGVVGNEIWVTYQVSAATKGLAMARARLKLRMTSPLMTRIARVKRVDEIRPGIYEVVLAIPIEPAFPEAFGQAAPLPPGVSREEAIEIVSKSEWAQNLAAGWLRAFMPELKPGTPEYEGKKNEIAKRVAAGVV